jgi:tRNA (guanine37-N1)-methyltransferase
VNGNHEEIRRWRRKAALAKTMHNRPDLLKGAELSEEDQQLLDEIGSQESRLEGQR